MDELFSPQRLRLARQRRGHFISELAARIGASTRSVSAWENSKAKPSDENLDALAKVLDFPRDFFMGDAPPVLQAAAFRSLSRMTARQRDMALAAGAQAVALDQWIAAKFSRPEPNAPDLRDSTPGVAADSLRALWGIGYAPAPNMVHLLEKNGVRVYSLVHNGSEVDAFSDWQGNVPFIFLNTNKTAERSRMDAAHELGHLVLHVHTSGETSKEQEDEAQAFASAFLMPAAPFIASAPRLLTLSTIIEAKQRWGVSALSYVYRLRTLGRLSEWHYRSLCIQIKSEYRMKEPGPERPRETSQVLSKVLTVTKDGGPSARRDIAKHLRVHLSDVDQLTFGLALTALIGGGQTTSAPQGARILKMVR